MKIWHVNLNEKNPNPLSSGVFTKLVVSAEAFEECEKKLREYLKANKIDPKDELYIGKIEFVEEVDIP